MAERKVLNKYIPPDFDPDKLLENKKLLKKIDKQKNKNKNKKRLLNIRMMYPFTLKCNKCNSFTYVGTKFNSKVEQLKDETYLNIPIWKFHGKCQNCKNEIIFKTDPKNGDYLLISGGTRTYDAHKEQEIADEFYRSINNADDDKIKTSEKESYNALLELKRNEQLEELQNINKRHIDKFNSINKALSHLYNKNQNENNENHFYMNNLDPEDEKIFFDLISKTRECADNINDDATKNKEDTYNTCKEEYTSATIEVEEEEIEVEEVEIEKVDARRAYKFSEMKEAEEAVNNHLINKKGANVENIKNPITIKESVNKNIHHNPDEIEKMNIENESTIKYGKTQLKDNIKNKNHSTLHLKAKEIFKKKNIATDYNFIIKKKDDLSNIFADYNSDNSDES